ncbi:Mediator of RNA polymerase II transcription subunit 19a [Capsicum annuum]|nr:Mediator of RNA polymerase II transcription subunit 19a [Capsicum annuum]
MDPDSKKFGRGPIELTGARDLISHFKLLPHYEFFGKRSLPLSISDTHYLHNVVGDTEIRKGEEMQLDQLTQGTSFSRETSSRIQPFDLDILGQAFQLRDTAPISLSPSDRGTPTIAGKSKSEMKDKEKKHKKHKDKDKEKDKEHKKHKHRHKDRGKDKDKEKKKDKSGHHDLGSEHSRKHEKKRKHDEEDLNGVHRHKKSKHKSSKIDEIGGIKMCMSSKNVMACTGVDICIFISVRLFLGRHGCDGEEFDPSSGLATCCLLEYDSMYPFLRALISSLSLKKPL